MGRFPMGLLLVLLAAALSSASGLRLGVLPSKTPNPRLWKNETELEGEGSRQCRSRRAAQDSCTPELGPWALTSARAARAKALRKLPEAAPAAADGRGSRRPLYLCVPTRAPATPAVQATRR